MMNNEINHYSELNKLVVMLAKADIPFEIYPFRVSDEATFQVCYPNKKDCICDAICHQYSYGYESGLLEIMGLAEPIEDNVEGWLTAEEVFKRISAHYNAKK